MISPSIVIFSCLQREFLMDSLRSSIVFIIFWKSIVACGKKSATER